MMEAALENGADIEIASDDHGGSDEFGDDDRSFEEQDEYRYEYGETRGQGDGGETMAKANVNT